MGRHTRRWWHAKPQPSAPRTGEPRHLAGEPLEPETAEPEMVDHLGAEAEVDDEVAERVATEAAPVGDETDAEPAATAAAEDEAEAADEPAPTDVNAAGAATSGAPPVSLFDDAALDFFDRQGEPTPEPEPEPEPEQPAESAEISDEEVAAAVEAELEHIVNGEAIPPAPNRVVEVHVLHQWEEPPTPQQVIVAAAPEAASETAPASELASPDLETVEPERLTVLADDPEPEQTRLPAPEHPRPPRKKREPLFSFRAPTPTGQDTPRDEPDEPERPTKKKRKMDNPDDGDQTWFDKTMNDAIDAGASDIHLVLDDAKENLTARIRVDGIMREYASITGERARAAMGQFVAAAGLASGSSFAPEETTHEVTIDGEKRKARVASFRTSGGGAALSLRLPPTGPLRTLDQLEFAPDNLTLLRDMLGSANKMLLFAGPMGSGKTTTVHGCLAELATPERNVWSIEDPVERILPNVTQLEANDANNAGFAELLPALVRSDYDVLFLGEIRDRKTAEAGVRQAKAGRQVVTTIHANNNVTALLRLIELADDSPLAVLDAVRGVVSQRLVRRLNPDWDGRDPMTKYRGRVPIHECLAVTEPLIEAFMQNAPLATINAAAVDASRGTFRADADRLITAGITDQDEIRRVLGND